MTTGYFKLHFVKTKKTLKSRIQWYRYRFIYKIKFIKYIGTPELNFNKTMRSRQLLFGINFAVRRLMEKFTDQSIYSDQFYMAIHQFISNAVYQYDEHQTSEIQIEPDSIDLLMQI